MKKLLLGLGMLLSGTVGFTGWCMAAVMKVEPGARSRIFGCLYGTDWLPVLFFAAMGSCRTGAGCAGSPPGQLISLCKTELSLPDGPLPDGRGSFFGSVNS